jgi:hypothetical protein
MFGVLFLNFLFAYFWSSSFKCFILQKLSRPWNRRLWAVARGKTLRSEVGYVCEQIRNCIWGFTSSLRLCLRLPIVLWFDCHPNHFKDQFSRCQMVVWERWDTLELWGARCVVSRGVTPENHKAQEGVSWGQWLIPLAMKPQWHVQSGGSVLKVYTSDSRVESVMLVG